MRSLRTRFLPAIVTGTSILLTLVCLEISVRLVNLDSPRVWEPDPVLGWRNVPYARTHYTLEGDGLIEINSDGYRDRPHAIAKDPRTYRIAIFGDSMTEAVQVNREQTFCS